DKHLCESVWHPWLSSLTARRDNCAIRSAAQRQVTFQLGHVELSALASVAPYLREEILVAVAMEDELALLPPVRGLQPIGGDDHARTLFLTLQDDCSGIIGVVPHILPRGHGASQHSEFERNSGLDDGRIDLRGERPCGCQRKKRTTNECLHTT